MCVVLLKDACRPTLIPWLIIAIMDTTARGGLLKIDLQQDQLSKHSRKQNRNGKSETTVEFSTRTGSRRTT
jgi:hypothetical protein